MRLVNEQELWTLLSFVAPTLSRVEGQCVVMRVKLELLFSSSSVQVVIAKDVANYYPEHLSYLGSLLFFGDISKEEALENLKGEKMCRLETYDQERIDRTYEWYDKELKLINDYFAHVAK